jgi:hypothetical protein
MRTIFGKLLASTPRFLKIDDQNRGDHPHLTADDECYFLYEYTSRRTYSFSSTNNLISNLKKKPSQPSAAAYRYKLGAMQACSRDLKGGINSAWLDGATVVPVPPSKARGHPDYDDRMTTICRNIAPGIDVREIVVQRNSFQAAHERTLARRSANCWPNIKSTKPSPIQRRIGSGSLTMSLPPAPTMWP